MSIVVTNNDAQVTPVAKAAEVVEKIETQSEAAGEELEQAETTDESETSDGKEAEKLVAKEGDEPADEESEGELEPKEEAPKKVGGAQKKINKLVGKLSAKEQEVEYWKAQALKSARPETTEKADAPKAAAEGKPDPNKFETHEEYVDALADWKVEQKLSARDVKAKEDSLKTDYQRQIASHVERVNTFAKATPDFHDAIEEIDHIPMSITVQDVILSSDDGPALMYALAKAPEEYERICKLPAIAAARALGKFEAQLKTEKPKKVEKKITKAPKPVSAVRGSSAGGAAKSLEDAAKMGAAEYQRMRMEQMKNKGSSWG